MVRFSKARLLGWLCACVVIAHIAVALLAPSIATNDPQAVGVHPKLSAPGSAGLLGSDRLGRDLFSRMAYGARASLIVSITASLIGVALGVLCGNLAGRTRTTARVMVSLATALSFIFNPLVVRSVLPLTLLFAALAIVASLGSSTFSVSIAVLVAIIPGAVYDAWMMTTTVTTTEFFPGAGDNDDAFRQTIVRPDARMMAPSAVGLIIISVGTAILLESTLTFLGVGLPLSTIAWGSILSDGRVAASAWWLMVFPFLAIVISAIAWNRLGHAVRGAPLAGTGRAV